MQLLNVIDLTNRLIKDKISVFGAMSPNHTEAEWELTLGLPGLPLTGEITVFIEVADEDAGLLTLRVLGDFNLWLVLCTTHDSCVEVTPKLDVLGMLLVTVVSRVLLSDNEGLLASGSYNIALLEMHLNRKVLVDCALEIRNFRLLRTHHVRGVYSCGGKKEDNG
jgi:hypothetical protein